MLLNWILNLIELVSTNLNWISKSNSICDGNLIQFKENCESFHSNCIFQVKIFDWLVNFKYSWITKNRVIVKSNSAWIGSFQVEGPSRFGKNSNLFQQFVRILGNEGEKAGENDWTSVTPTCRVFLSFFFCFIVAFFIPSSLVAAFINWRMSASSCHHLSAFSTEIFPISMQFQLFLSNHWINCPNSTDHLQLFQLIVVISKQWPLTAPLQSIPIQISSM